MRLILPPMKTRMRQSPHLPLLVSRKGMSRVRPVITDTRLIKTRTRFGERWRGCGSVWKPWKPTSVVKEPPNVDGSFALFLLKLLAALQQPLLGGAERRLGLWKQHDREQRKDPVTSYILSSSSPCLRRGRTASPLMISGLLWLLVTFDGLESESESLARLTEITTSLLLIGGFS